VKPYAEYLDLLEKLTENLEQLCTFEKQKTAAVKRDDLQALNDIMKQEQVLALAFRGQEQKRDALLKELQMGDVRLHDVYRHYPADMQIQAKKTTEALHRQYQIYQCASEVARNTLECNLREIEKILESTGQGEALNELPGIPPVGLRTDFRA